jgi:hypothetical protein
MRFIDATNTDWLSGEWTERMLRDVITDIVKELVDYRVNLKQWLSAKHLQEL